MQTTWDSWGDWESSDLAGTGDKASLPAYFEHAPITEIDPVESWTSWDAQTEETSSWLNPSQEMEITYMQPTPTALFDQPSLIREDTSDSYVKRPAPANQKRPISQPLALAIDEPSKQESSRGNTITCPNCGESKGSKGTWCRSAACVSRRQALAANKVNTKSISRADSSTVFRCDEPAYRYHTPPSNDTGNIHRTDPGAPIYETIKAASCGETSKAQRPTVGRESKQSQQPAVQSTAPRSPSPGPNASPRDRFYAEVVQLQEAAGTPFVKVPTVGMKTLDLYTLYQEVSTRGGMHEVVSKKLWKSVAATLKLPTTCTDYGFRLRRHYERYLLAYEQKHLGTVPPQKTGTNSRKKRKQRSERASRRPEQEAEEWAANPYSKQAYYNHA